MKAAPRALLLPGSMNHVRINGADVMRESAGCLTCEQKIEAALMQHGFPSPRGEGVRHQRVYARLRSAMAAGWGDVSVL